MSIGKLWRRLSGAKKRKAKADKIPADLRALEALLSENRPGEVGLSAYRIRLEKAEASLKSELALRPKSEQLQLLAARMCSKREKWPDAIVAWSKVSRFGPEVRAEAFLALAVAYRNIGAYQKATSSLRSAKRNGASDAAANSEQRRIDQRSKASAASTVSQIAVEILDRNGGPAEALTMLNTSMTLQGASPAVVSAVREFLGENKAVAETSATPPRSIFFGGFGWSGSGALVDYAIQHPSGSMPFGAYEAALFADGAGVEHAVKRIIASPKQAENTIAIFILSTVFGVTAPTAVDLQRWHLRSVVGMDGANIRMDHIVRAALRLRYVASAGELEESELRAAFRQFVGEILATKIPEGKIGISGNCITAANAASIDYVENGVLVGVFRDPRDQYVAQRYEHNAGEMAAPDRFISKMRRRLAAFTTAESSIDTSKIIRVQFEDFIDSEEYRTTLFDKIGLPLSLLTNNPTRYHPEKSRPNIGIYKSYADQSEIKQIEAAFPQLLVS